jgi:hypothetical protein
LSRYDARVASGGIRVLVYLVRAVNHLCISICDIYKCILDLIASLIDQSLICAVEVWTRGGSRALHNTGFGARVLKQNPHIVKIIFKHA